MNLLSKNTKFNIIALVAFFILTFPAYRDLLKSGMISGHDTEGHLVRLIEFDKALKDGHFPVRWSKRLNYGLGYPFFTFDYPGTYYLADLIYYLKHSYVNSLKLIFLLSFPFTGFFGYLWLKNHFDIASSFIGGLFLSIVPYHFVNVYVRGDFGEAIGLTMVPLNFYLIDRILTKKRWLDVFLFALAFGLLIIMHNLTALVFLFIFIIYGLLNSWLKKDYFFLRKFLLGLVWGIALSAFFVIPALVYKKDTFLDILLSKYFLQNFPSLKSLIYSPWGFGTSKSGPGEMSFQIGILHELATLVGITLLLLSIKIKKVRRKFALFGVGLLIISLFLMQEISLPVWEKFKTLQLMQFPWRFLGVVNLTCSILLTYSISLFKSWFKYITVVLLILGLLFINHNYWHVNKYYTYYDYYGMDGYFGTTTIAGEQAPKWQIPDEQFIPHVPYKKISGDFTIDALTWKTNLHQFRVNATKSSVIVDRTDYFPGWHVFIDSNEVNRIDQNDPLIKGMIGFTVPSGDHLVEIKLLETPLEKLSDAISLLALLVGFVVIKGRYDKKIY